MGPRFFNRGNAAAARHPEAAQLTRLQWGRGFSTAEMSADACQPSMSGRSAFNGAAVFQPRKSGLAPVARASSRRLQWGRGFSTAEMIGCTPRIGCKPTRPFNGAAVFQPRKSALTAWSPTASNAAFNGAAVFQPRKSRPLARHSAWLYVPSMGPRFFNRGNDLHRRKCTARIGQPSMGPRFFNRGNRACGLPSTARQMRLQWGRGFSTAEIAVAACDRAPPVMPSMGPRFFNRGNVLGRGAGVRRPVSAFNGAAVFQPRKSCRDCVCFGTSDWPSMGPRFFNRGNAWRGAVGR